MNQLQLERRKREQYVGPWLPEPILTEEIPEAADPQERVEKEESISLAFLILWEREFCMSLSGLCANFALGGAESCFRRLFVPDQTSQTFLIRYLPAIRAQSSN